MTFSPWVCPFCDQMRQTAAYLPYLGLSVPFSKGLIWYVDVSRTDDSRTTRFSGTILQLLEEGVNRLIVSFKRSVAGNKNKMNC